jgi:hypothetical protein
VLSDDAVTDAGDPQQVNGYTYANGNPTTSSDPSGVWTDDHGKAPVDPNPKSPSNACDFWHPQNLDPPIPSDAIGGTSPTGWCSSASSPL